MDQIPNEALPQERVTVCDVQFRSGSKVYFFDPGNLTVLPGMEVIVDTAHGQEFGRCHRGNHMVNANQVVQPLRQVIRIATPRDQKINDENRVLEKKAFEFCRKKIEELGLDMLLTSTEYTFDGSKVMFYFTADNRVDFRELVKILASQLHTRIELRQIGVRDKAKMVGGLGICGRPFCCGEFLEEFQPVSIKMAKTQSLSLNPSKISGTCGRLMCCLNYEQEAYEDLLRNSPKMESFVDTPDGRGTVTNVNLLRQSVNVRLEKQPDTIVCHKNCDICVLRNGKPKKTDEPIPEDLAPISGGRVKPEEELGFSTYLEPTLRNSEAGNADENGKRRRKNAKTELPEAESADKQEQKTEKKAKKAEQKANKAAEKNADRKPKSDKKTDKASTKASELAESLTAQESVPKSGKKNEKRGDKNAAKRGKKTADQSTEQPAESPEGKKSGKAGKPRAKVEDKNSKSGQNSEARAAEAQAAEVQAQEGQGAKAQGAETVGTSRKSYFRRNRYYRNHKPNKKPEG